MSGAGVGTDRASSVRSARLGYIPALDGLRAVAVVAVLLYHGDVRWMHGGFLGVDVFFVISGYLITCLLLGDWRTTGKVGLRNFWLRRARRLLPALYVMLGVVSVYALVFLSGDLSKLRGEVWAALAYVENWFLIFHHLSYFESVGRPPLLQHVWSLAVEEQFYLLWPPLFTLGLTVWGKKRGRLLVAVLGAAAASAILMAALYKPLADPSRVYYGTDTRAAALLVGAALALVWAPWRLSRRTGRGAPFALDLLGIAGLAGLAWFFVTVDQFDSGLYRGGFLAVAVVTGLVIAATVHPAARLLPAVLGIRVLRWVGLRSYGIYLWHWPVFMVTRPHLDIDVTGIPLLLLRIGITLVIASLSYRYVEQPIRHGALGRRIAELRRAGGPRRWQLATRFAVVGTALALAVAMIGVGLANAGPAPAPPGISQASVVVTGPPSTTSTSTTAPPSPAPGPPPAPLVSPLPGTRVTAVGDSVMLGANRAVVDALGPNLLNLNAAVSRQFPAAISVVTLLKAAGVLGDEVVVHMGTNGTVTDSQFDDMMKVLAGAKRVVFINAKVPRPWEQQVNDTLAAGVKRYPNTVLIDWHTIGNQHPEYFAADGIHLEASGAQAYAQLILNAL